MTHDITYTARDGTSYDLSGAKGADALLSWDSSVAAWEYDADSSTGALSRKAAECSVRLLVPRASLDGLMERLYQDAEAGGGTLSADGWSRRASARAGSYDKLPGGDALVALTLMSREPLWRRVTTHELLPGSATATEGLDLPCDLAYDLAGTASSGGLASLSSASYFLARCIFWGPCEDPWVQLSVRTTDGTTATNRYGVRASAEVGERIVIDPTATHELGGSVYRVDSRGARANLFSSRVRGVEGSGSYVFQKLPSGAVSATWPQGYGVTLDVIEERGSLPWT